MTRPDYSEYKHHPSEMELKPFEESFEFDEAFPESLQVTFQEIGKNVQYTLVEVPLSIPVHMEYRKPDLGLDLNLTPLTFSYWAVEGSADSDIIANLGFVPPEQRRRGPIPPLVTEREMEAIREFGEAGIIENDLNPDLVYVNLALPVNHLYDFFGKIWQPSRSARQLHSLVEQPYHTGDPLLGLRRLPEKTPSNAKNTASLRVVIDSD